jgi:hypothetical protein
MIHSTSSYPIFVSSPCSQPKSLNLIPELSKPSSRYFNLHLFHQCLHLGSSSSFENSILINWPELNTYIESPWLFANPPKYQVTSAFIITTERTFLAVQVLGWETRRADECKIGVLGICNYDVGDGIWSFF